ncbi:hypothetical protein [Flavisphingomonas formosensis]|nr:hypothetical protein [Sphingomonas formosensis]
MISFDLQTTWFHLVIRLDHTLLPIVEHLIFLGRRDAPPTSPDREPSS